MTRNLRTGLKRRRRADPMRDYDKLPPALRRWLAEAALPWSPASVRRAWVRALRETCGCEKRALSRLNRAESRLLARDARGIWGTPEPPGISRAEAR